MQLYEEGTHRAAEKMQAKREGKAEGRKNWGLLCSMCDKRTKETNIARRYTSHTYQHLVVWLCACLRQFVSADTWGRHAREGCRASTRAAMILATKAGSFTFVVDRAGVGHAVAFAKKHWGEYIKNKAEIDINLKPGNDYRVTNPSREVVFEPIPFTAARLPCQESCAEVDGMRTASVPVPLKKRAAKGAEAAKPPTRVQPSSLENGATKDAKAAKPSIQVQPSPLNERATAGGKAPKSSILVQPSRSKRSGNTVRERSPAPKRACPPAIHPAFAHWVPVGRCVEVMSEGDERWFRRSCQAFATPSVADARPYLVHLYKLLTGAGDITLNERSAIRFVLSDNEEYDGADRHAPPLRGLVERLKYAGELTPHEYVCMLVFIHLLESGGM